MVATQAQILQIPQRKINYKLIKVQFICFTVEPLNKRSTLGIPSRMWICGAPHRVQQQLRASSPHLLIEIKESICTKEKISLIALSHCTNAAPVSQDCRGGWKACPASKSGQGGDREAKREGERKRLKDREPSMLPSSFGGAERPVQQQAVSICQSGTSLALSQAGRQWVNRKSLSLCTLWDNAKLNRQGIRVVSN